VPWLRRPAVALVVAAGSWGLAVSGTKYALGGFDPVTLLSVELLSGAGVLWVALLVRGYRPPGSWWLPAVLGLLEPALAYLGDTLGLSLTSAVHGAVIGGLEPGLVVLLAAVLLREAVTRPAVLAVVVGLGGLAVLAGLGTGAGGGAAAGDLLVAGGALSASLYTIVAKRFDDGCDSLSLTAWQFTVAALASLLVSVVRWTAGAGTGARPAAPGFWLAAVLVGAGGFGLGFLLFNTVIVQVDAGRAAVVLNLIPVFGVAGAVVFLGEGVTARDGIGAVLIGSSVLYFAIADHRGAAARDPGSGPAAPVAGPVSWSEAPEPDSRHFVIGALVQDEGGPRPGGLDVLDQVDLVDGPPYLGGEGLDVSGAGLGQPAERGPRIAERGLPERVQPVEEPLLDVVGSRVDIDGEVKEVRDRQGSGRGGLQDVDALEDKDVGPPHQLLLAGHDVVGEVRVDRRGHLGRACPHLLDEAQQRAPVV
jgi:O-acetylserine/cysteine efflux transporter